MNNVLVSSVSQKENNFLFLETQMRFGRPRVYLRDDEIFR